MPEQAVAKGEVGVVEPVAQLAFGMLGKGDVGQKRCQLVEQRLLRLQPQIDSGQVDHVVPAIPWLRTARLRTER